MLMAVFFVVIALCFALGPLMLMRPSSRQMKLADLRTKATQRGLSVRIAKTIADVPPASLAIYILRLDIDAKSPMNRVRWALVRKKFAHGLHFAGVWDWQDNSKVASIDSGALTKFVEKLPDTIVAVQQEGKELCVYWKESVPDYHENAEAIENIYTILTGLSGLVLKA